MPEQASDSGITSSTTTDAEQHTQPIALSIESAARAIDVSRTWLYEQIREGRLASRKVAGRRLIMHSDLVRFVRGGGDGS